MKITAIIEDTKANVVGVVIDDATEYTMTTSFPRDQIGTIGTHVAELAGYTVDCDTLELTPLHAPTA